MGLEKIIEGMHAAITTIGHEFANPPRIVSDAIWGYLEGIWTGGDMIGSGLALLGREMEGKNYFLLGYLAYYSRISERKQGIINPENSKTYTFAKCAGITHSLSSFSPFRPFFYLVINVGATLGVRSALWAEAFRQKQDGRNSGSYGSANPSTSRISTSQAYNILGLPEGTPLDDVKKQYRTLAMACHPDRHHGDKKKAEEFIQLQSAYELLTQPPKDGK